MFQFGSVGSTLVSIVLLAAAETVAKSIADDGAADAKVKDLTTAIYVIGGCLLVLNLFFIILSSLLFHGAKNGRPSMILPWLILCCIAIFSQPTKFSLLIRFIWAYSSADDIYVVNAASIISTLFGLAVQVFIYSLVRKNRKDETRPKDAIEKDDGLDNSTDATDEYLTADESESNLVINEDSDESENFLSCNSQGSDPYVEIKEEVLRSVSSEDIFPFTKGALRCWTVKFSVSKVTPT